MLRCCPRAVPETVKCCARRGRRWQQEMIARIAFTVLQDGILRDVIPYRLSIATSPAVVQLYNKGNFLAASLKLRVIFHRMFIEFLSFLFIAQYVRLCSFGVRTSAWMAIYYSRVPKSLRISSGLPDCDGESNKTREKQTRHSGSAVLVHGMMPSGSPYILYTTVLWDHITAGGCVGCSHCSHQIPSRD